MTVRTELLQLFQLFNQITASHLRRAITDAEYRQLIKALEERRAVLVKALRP